jgi:hypothetical protein
MNKTRKKIFKTKVLGSDLSVIDPEILRNLLMNSFVRARPIQNHQSHLLGWQ